MINYLARLFGYTAGIFFVLWSIYCYGNNEVELGMIVIVTLVASSFNVVFIGVFEMMKISEFQKWPLIVTLLEVLIYTLLLGLIEELIFGLDFIEVNNPFFNFPFPFIYPFVVIALFCQIYRKWFLHQNEVKAENDDILDA